MNFENETLIQKANRLFFQAMVNRSLHEMARSLYGLLGCPVFIVDAYANKMVMEPAKPINDADWDYLLSANATSIDHFQDFYTKYGNLDNVQYPLLICDGNRSKTRQLISQYIYHGRVLGSSGLLLFDKEVTDEEMAVVRLFNQAVTSEFIRLESESKTTQLLDSEKLYAIISSDTGDDAALSDDYHSLALRFKPTYQMLAIKSFNREITSSVLQRISKELTKSQPFCIATVCADMIYVLYSSMGMKQSQDAQTFLKSMIKDKLLSELMRYEFQIGVSERFDQTNNIRIFSHQAALTLEAGHQQQPTDVCYFSDALLPRQIFSAVTSHYSPEIFCPPIIHKISRYDKEYNQDFLKTLKYYLYFNMNVRKTAQYLSIHENTLRYRIERISDLFDIDLKSEQTYHQLNCYFLLLDAAPHSDI